MRGTPSSEDAAAGPLEAFVAELGHFRSARFGSSRSAVDMAFRKHFPLPAVSGGRSSGQSYRRGGAESAGSPPAVQAQREGLALALSLTLTCAQMVVVVVVRPGSHPQTVNSQ